MDKHTNLTMTVATNNKVECSKSRRYREAEELYDNLEEPIDYNLFQSILDDLIDIGYLTRSTNDVTDVTIYQAGEHVTWATVVCSLSCNIKQQILLQLIDNPITFFVLYNTQGGKLRIAANEMYTWATNPTKKVVSFLIVDNAKDLADQSVEGVSKITETVAKLYTLSSNSGDIIENITAQIDSYAAFGGKMPIITALNNATQIKKVVALMEHIRTRMTDCPTLCYGVVFDEADNVYPTYREKFTDLIVNNTTGLHRLGFVTATEGDLMNIKENIYEYPECANAQIYEVPPSDPNYRAMHTQDTTINYTKHLVKDSNDVYAENVIAKNREHFNGKVTLKDGTQGYRKIIVNGGAKISSMVKFANQRVSEDSYAITLNMYGVNVFRPGFEKERYSTKKQRLSAVLFKLYTELGLHDKPLYIIGNRKVDRGLGFHHAPREDGNPSPGLIWTDMILGRIDDKNTAVQKAGRLAGIIAHCPQYPSTLTWWTDVNTATRIINHNNMVDEANKKKSCSAIQAIVRGEEQTKQTHPAPRQDHDSHLSDNNNGFDTMEELAKYWKTILEQKNALQYYTKPRTPHKNKDGEFICSIGAKSGKQDVDNIINKFKGPDTSNWGSGWTEAKPGEYVHRVYVGYDAQNKPKFLLRWAMKN